MKHQQHRLWNLLLPGIVISLGVIACSISQQDISMPPSNGASRNGVLTPPAEKSEMVKNLIVKITSNDESGTGIVFGQMGDLLFIVTANQVVRNGTRARANPNVAFRFWPEAIQADLLRHYDTKLNVAVLSVDMQRIRTNKDAFSACLPLSQVHYISDISLSKPQYFFGYLSGEEEGESASTVPTEYDRTANTLYLHFPSDRGYQGGGLFDAEWNLVAMITGVAPPLCKALSFAAIQESLQSWRFAALLSAAPASPSTPEPELALILPTPGPSSTASPTPPPSPGSSPTPSPTPSPTSSATPSSAPDSSATPSPMPSPTPSPTSSATPSPAPDSSATPSSLTPSPTSSPKPPPAPDSSATPSSMPSVPVEPVEPITGMQFVWVEGGCFEMGQSDQETQIILKNVSQEDYTKDYAHETPIHEVCVDGFWMGRYEVTQEQWMTVMSAIPEDSRDEETSTHPIQDVSWDTIQAFLKGLNYAAGQDIYRLPTEAEWEYACRAGTQTPQFWGDNMDWQDKTTQACQYANVNDQSYINAPENKEKNPEHAYQCDDGYTGTAPVGSFSPNAFGLYDMLGNVWEWCQDAYSADYYGNSPKDNPVNQVSEEADTVERVLRGGAWDSVAWHIRCTTRIGRESDTKAPGSGFRVVRIAGEE